MGFLLLAVIKRGVLLGDGAVKNESSSSCVGAGKPPSQGGAGEGKTGMAPYPVPSGDGLEPPTCLFLGPALLIEMEMVNFSNQMSKCNVYYQGRCYKSS